jgi:metallo-beta-lactamase class B
VIGHAGSRTRLCVIVGALTFVCLGAFAQSPAIPAAEPAPPANDTAMSAEVKSWYEPAEPMQIVGPIYFVGTRGLGVYLVATPAGTILIDGAPAEAAPLIEASIRKLGFKPEQIRQLLITHAHYDHVGTLAHFKARSGAPVAVMAADVDLLKSGGTLDYLFADDPKLHFEGVTADRALNDGDTVELGGVKLTAHHTPGHTRGCTTWTTTVDDHGHAYAVEIVGSTSVNPGTRLVNDPSYPGIADDYRHSLSVLASLQPDIFLAPHTSFFDFERKRSHAATQGVRAFVDPDGYRQRVAASRAAFEDAVAREAN